MESIAIYGGSFDPIHNGHLAVANYVIKRFPLDKLIFLPSKVHAFKGRINQISNSDRLELIHLAIKDNKNFFVDDFELRSEKKINYTCNYIEHLKDKDINLFFVIGSDNISGFSKWKRWEYILKNAIIISYARPNYPNVLTHDLIDYKDRFILVEDELLDISSSEIKSGKLNKNLFPDEVFQYIIKKRLYVNE
jgi:nicotinate-nucleotide adenylyltransferase